MSRTQVDVVVLGSGIDGSTVAAPELAVLPGGREPSVGDPALVSPHAAASIRERLKSFWTRTGHRAGVS